MYVTTSLCCQGCLKCHPECRTCNGPGLSFCTQCLHLREDNKCVSNCSVDYFYDVTNDVCSPCSPHCHRCTGPTAADCITCRHFKLVYRTATNDQDSTEVWPCLCYFSSLMEQSIAVLTPWCQTSLSVAFLQSTIVDPKVPGLKIGVVFVILVVVFTARCTSA